MQGEGVKYRYISITITMSEMPAAKNYNVSHLTQTNAARIQAVLEIFIDVIQLDPFRKSYKITHDTFKLKGINPFDVPDVVQRINWMNDEQFLEFKIDKKYTQPTILTWSQQASGTEILPEASTLTLLKTDSDEILKSILETIRKSRQETNEPSATKSTAKSLPTIPVPTGTRWEQMEFAFKDETEVEISISGRHFVTADYEKLGFRDKRKTKSISPYDNQWRFLYKLAPIQYAADNPAFFSEDGKIHVTATVKEMMATLGTTEANIFQIKDNLSQTLRKVFGISDDPFDDYDIVGCYRTRFKLLPVSLLRGSGTPLTFTSEYNDKLGYNDSSPNSEE